jgi:exodeoxyribonuclease-3
MKIATFNVNGVNPRLPNLLEWLAKDSPDVVCLQELKATQQQFPAKAIRDAGYHALWKGEPLWNGVAILAKTAPVEIRRVLPGQDKDPHARYLEAAVGGVVIACLYLPNGNPIRSPKFQYKLAWFDALLVHAQALWDSKQPVVLVGDFNVVPTDDDIYDPKSWKRDALLQPESRARYATLLEQGWLDSLRVFFSGKKGQGDERVYTFWDYFRNHWQRNAGLRIDHLLLSKVLQPRLEAAGVDRWVRDRPKASDHAPTWITLADAVPKRASRSVKRAPRSRTRRPEK